MLASDAEWAFQGSVSCAEFADDGSLGVDKCEETWAVARASDGTMKSAYDACEVSCGSEGGARHCNYAGTSFPAGFNPADPDCNDPCPTWPYECSEDGETIVVAVGQPIQQAIDSVPSDGMVMLEAGVHEIEVALVIDSAPVHLVGE